MKIFIIHFKTYISDVREIAFCIIPHNFIKKNPQMIKIFHIDDIFLSVNLKLLIYVSFMTLNIPNYN